MFPFLWNLISVCVCVLFNSILIGKLAKITIVAAFDDFLNRNIFSIVVIAILVLRMELGFSCGMLLCT